MVTEPVTLRGRFRYAFLFIFSIQNYVTEMDFQFWKISFWHKLRHQMTKLWEHFLWITGFVSDPLTFHTSISTETRTVRRHPHCSHQADHPHTHTHTHSITLLSMQQFKLFQIVTTPKNIHILNQLPRPAKIYLVFQFTQKCLCVWAMPGVLLLSLTSQQYHSNKKCLVSAGGLDTILFAAVRPSHLSF